ncbi:hypothetical protein M1523_02005 [Patescibacteria group bacterium]|nr:hypothetical protein [Patescibacteria group bacterium]MCL5091985.1 hypothetical protein [Patescibacteria group bacterium]
MGNNPKLRKIIFGLAVILTLLILATILASLRKTLMPSTAGVVYRNTDQATGGSTSSSGTTGSQPGQGTSNHPIEVYPSSIINLYDNQTSNSQTNIINNGQNSSTLTNPVPYSSQYVAQYRTGPSTGVTNQTDSSPDLTALFTSLFNINISGLAFNNAVLSPTPQPIPAPAPLGKIGVFIMSDYSTGAKQIVAAKPQIIKVMDPQIHNSLLDAVKEYKRINPSGKVVLRFYEGTQNWHFTETDDPETSAQTFFTSVIHPGLALLGNDVSLFDYLETPNELDNTPGWNDSTSVSWLSRFWVKLINLNQSAGIKTCVASIPVANPPGDLNEVKTHLTDFVPALLAAQSAGGALCYHAYTLQYTQDVGAEIYTSLHYRTIHQAIAQLNSNLATLPVILSEAGVDQSGNPQTSGWQAHGTIQQYVNWIDWFAQQINQDQYVIGATLYQIGDGYWSSFNLEPLAGWLASNLSH